MKITKQEVAYVSKLARLELSEVEKEIFAGQLESILGHIEHLEKADTTNVVPTSHVLDLVNVWRKDEAKLSSRELTENLLANAPERSGNFYKVKKVIE